MGVPNSDTNLIGVKIPTQKVVQVRVWRSLILSTGFLTYDYGVQLRGMVSLLEHGCREEGNEGKDINEVDGNRKREFEASSFMMIFN